MIHTLPFNSDQLPNGALVIDLNINKAIKKIVLSIFKNKSSLAHSNMTFFSSFFFAGLLPEFDAVDKTNPNCVIIGDAAENFSYQNLNEAFRVLIGLEKPVLFSLGQG